MSVIFPAMFLGVSFNLRRLRPPGFAVLPDLAIGEGARAFGGLHGKRRDLAFEIRALARRTGRLGAGSHERLELVAAGAAHIKIERHRWLEMLPVLEAR